MASRGDRITAAAAAREIGCNVEFLRRQMQRKDEDRWDLGEVVPPEVPGGNYQYFIFRGKLDRFLGRKDQKQMQYETYAVIRCKNSGFIFNIGDTVTVILKNGKQISDCMIAMINEGGFIYKQGRESGKVEYSEVVEVKHYAETQMREEV